MENSDKEAIEIFFNQFGSFEDIYIRVLWEELLKELFNKGNNE